MSHSALENDICEQLLIGEIELDDTEIKIITGIEDFDALEQDWNELAWETDTLIFQTFEWNRIWWNHFGANKNLYIIAFYIENKLAGIAPLFTDNVTLFGREVYNCLRFLGSYVSQPEGEPLMGSIPYSDYLDCIIYPGFEKIFYKKILQHFKMVESYFDEIVLDEISEESAIHNTLIPLLAKSSHVLSYKIEQASSSPIIQLDSSWNSYLDSMTSKERNNAKRYFKRSNRKNKIFKIEKLKHADELPRLQREFIRLHQQQWNNRGFAGTFLEQRMRDFFMEISRSFYKKDWLEFHMAIPAGEEEKIAAVDVIITYKNRLYLLHRGMDEDPLYRKKGPGNVLLFARINEAIKDGAKVFDMLRGTEEFKLRMATKIKQNKKIIVSSRFKTREILPGLVKNFMKIIQHVRIEKSHMKFVFNGKIIFKGVTEYMQFLLRRTRHKFQNR